MDGSSKAGGRRTPRADFYTGGSACGKAGRWLAGGLLIDPDGDRRARFACTVAGAANRRGAERIETYGHPHVGFGWADAMDRVEADPAKPRHMGLGPGVAAAFRLGAAAAVAGDIAGRNLQAAGGTEKDMRQVGGAAAFVLEGLDGRDRRRPGRVGFVDEFFMQAVEQCVQLGKR